jgi:hypothetical protein
LLAPKRKRVSRGSFVLHERLRARRAVRYDRSRSSQTGESGHHGDVVDGE